MLKCYHCGVEDSSLSSFHRLSMPHLPSGHTTVVGLLCEPCHRLMTIGDRLRLYRQWYDQLSAPPWIPWSKAAAALWADSVKG